ncbi:MAG: endonuclease [Paludibacter sp.]
MKRFLLLSSLFCFFYFSGYSVIPTGYYTSTEGKKAATLKTELHNIICQDTSQYLDYGSGKGKTWEGFYTTDRNPTTNAVIDMYSDSLRYYPVPNPNFTAFGSAVEIEHSVPKSWWKCDITHPDSPAKDLNHLFPADGTTNMSKNDNPLGVVTGTPTKNNGVSKIGPAVYDGYVGAVFEPADQYKGVFARAYFYMATAYEHYAKKWDTAKPENMMESNTYPVLKPWAIKLLLQWHRDHPVSIREITRNDLVYNIQKNRNPYIDYPFLVEYIWGTRTTIPYKLDNNIIFPYLNWPNDNDTLNIGKVLYSGTKDTTINVQAMNLTGDLTLSLGGLNAANYSVDKSIITKAEAEAGTVIHLHYKASSVGTQTALLSIYGGGINTITLKLKTFTSDEFGALPASNTSNNGFVADWTPSSGASGYSINVYTIEKTGFALDTLLKENFKLLLTNLWLKEGSTENSVGGPLKLATGSNYGKVTTPPLDLSKTTSSLTVTAKQFNTDAGAKLTATLDNQPLAVWTTAVANQDFTVELPISTPVSKISLSAIAGKRVYIDFMKVTSQIPVYGPVSVAGYPKSVGNVLTFSVDGLKSSSDYYYTITPIGNGGSVSNQVSVQTTTKTGLENQADNHIVWNMTTTGISISNVTVGSKIQLLDMMGRQIQRFTSTASDFTINIREKGIYLLRIHEHQGLSTFKITY